MNSGVLRVSKKLIAFVLLLGVLVVCALFVNSKAHAVTGINSQLNFQGRLLNAQGATVPDGYYNVEFKIYQDGDGQTVASTGSPLGTPEWTETYLNNNSKGVMVKNGYMSVSLGSINPFGSNIDWNQNTLWLSVNIGNTNVSCTPFSSCVPDGEMLPMKRLSATPYSLNSGLLNGLNSTQFLQLAQGVQTDASTNTSSIFVNKTGTGNLLTLQSAGNDAFTLNNSGDILFGANANHTISVTTAATTVAGKSMTLTAGAAGTGASALTGGDLVLQGGNGGGTNGDGGNVAINAGGKNGAGNDGAISIGVSRASTIQIGSSTLASGTQNINIGNNNTAGGTTNVSIGTGSSAAGGTTTVQSKGAMNVTSGGTTTVSGVGDTSVSSSGGKLTLSGSGDTSLTSASGNTTVSSTAGTLGLTGSGGVTLNSSAGNTIVSSTNGTLSLSSSNNANLTSSAGTAAVSGNGNTSVTSVAGTLSLSGYSNTSLTSTNSSVDLSSKTNTTISTNGTIRATFDTSNGLYLGNGVTAAAPNSFKISGTGSSTTGVTGGALTVQGGNATVGNANGGTLTLSGGTGFGTGANGLVVITTPTFSTTANDPNCYTSGALVAADCTIAASSINNSSAILVGFSVTGKTSILPDPTISTAGRVVYITAANSSSDFILSVNGGGMGNTIAMRQNTTATMIWNGADWTAAGASSSTTLQSAYDNTMQSAGGAELVVSHTGTTDGLTIRDSSTNPVDGTLLSVQTASAAGLFSVNSNVTEYSSDSGAETAGASASTFPTNTWSLINGSTVTRYTTAGNYIATGQASIGVTTNTTAGSGVKDTLSTALSANTNYNVSFTTRLLSGAFTDMDVYYSIDGTVTSVPCITSKAVNTSVWTKVNCTFAAPASGITAANAIMIRQTSAGTARTFYIDNLSVTIAADYNYATDGNVTDSANFATNWTTVASAGISRSTSVGNDASDSAQVTTTGTGQGVRNKLSINPLANTLYRITVYAASTTSGFNNFNIRYSRNGGTNFTSCADYNTQTVSSSTSNFTKITCYITTDGIAPTNSYVYFTQSDATARTFFIDTFSMTLSTNSTPNVQIGGGVNGGPVTLLTLDRGASAPIASDNDALLGSMYYDTSLGKLQCYEADGWGACGSSPDNVVTISPEYTNAVMHGTGVGTMTSDLCSDTLNINDNAPNQICGTNETYNFYKWTSPQASNQTYSIYVTYQLPSTFKSFASGQTSVMGRTDSANATVQYQIFRNDSTAGLLTCGGVTSVSTGAMSAWQTKPASGAADPSTCGFAPGNSIVFKIDVISRLNGNAYVGNLNFIFSNR